MMMDQVMDRAARRNTITNGGQRAHALLLGCSDGRRTVRAVASATALALLALSAVASLGSAQARRDTGAVSRVTASTLPGWLVTSASGDATDKRGGDPESGLEVDAWGIAFSVRAMADSLSRSGAPIPTFRSRSDSLVSMRTMIAADKARDLRLVISLNDRKLWAIVGSDTLLATRVAVSTDETLEYGGRTWRFETPRGVRTVLGKRENPVWSPPDWHYAEMAREHSLDVAPMNPGKTVLRDGRWLETRD